MSEKQYHVTCECGRSVDLIATTYSHRTIRGSWAVLKPDGTLATSGSDLIFQVLGQAENAARYMEKRDEFRSMNGLKPGESFRVARVRLVEVMDE